MTLQLMANDEEARDWRAVSGNLAIAHRNQVITYSAVTSPCRSGLRIQGGISLDVNQPGAAKALQRYLLPADADVDGGNPALPAPQ